MSKKNECKCSKSEHTYVPALNSKICKCGNLKAIESSGVPTMKNPPPPPPKDRVLTEGKSPPIPPPTRKGRTIKNGRAYPKEVVTPFLDDYVLVNKINPKYRILQSGSNCFEVQKLFIETKSTGFWRRKKTVEEYHTIDSLGRKYFNVYSPRRGSKGNSKDLLKFKSLKKAKQAIKDLQTYPVIHNVDEL